MKRIDWNRKVTTFLLVLVLVTTPVIGTFGLTDIEGHWGESAIDTLVRGGVLSGYPDGTFRPDTTTTRAEFTAMSLKVMGESLPVAASGSYWAGPIVDLAEKKGLFEGTALVSLSREALDEPMTRQEMAGVLVNLHQLQSVESSVDKEVQAPLDFDEVTPLYREAVAGAMALGYLSGYPDGCYRPLGALTRAESATVLAKFLADETVLPEKMPAESLRVGGLQLGDMEDQVVTSLGDPDRVDVSPYGFDWWIYTGAAFYAIGMDDGEVVALMTLYGEMTTAEGALTEDRLAAEKVSTITRGNVHYRYDWGPGLSLYTVDGDYVSLYEEQDKIIGMKIIDGAWERQLNGYYGERSATLAEDYSKQILDLTNTYRRHRGLNTLRAHAAASAVVEAHAADMAARSYFAHVSPEGTDPFDRLKAEGITYRGAGENIAAGQVDAFAAFIGWVNSPGHQTNLVGDYEALGTGVCFGGDYGVYYGQNFLKF